MEGDIRLDLYKHQSTSYIVVKDGRPLIRIECLQDMGAQTLIEVMQELFRERETGVPVFIK